MWSSHQEQIVNQVKILHFIRFSWMTVKILRVPAFIPNISNDQVSGSMLLCKTLRLHVKGGDIFSNDNFQCVHNFFSEHSIPAQKCPGIYTMVHQHILLNMRRLMPMIQDCCYMLKAMVVTGWRPEACLCRMAKNVVFLNNEKHVFIAQMFSQENFIA